MPFAGQFSPKQVDLLKLMSICEHHSGDRPALVQAIRNEFFSGHTADQRDKLAGNTVLALRAYGLLADDWQISKLGHRLSTLSENELYAEFARHILDNLHGLDLLRTIEAIQAAGERVTLESISRELRTRGIKMPWGGMHISGMRGWLEKAGVFRSRWQIDGSRMQELLGASRDVIASAEEFTIEQRAFLRALSNLDTGEAVPWRSVTQYASALYGIEFPQKSFPKQVLFSLRDSGLIEILKTTSGRGAKPYLVKLTDQVRRERVEPLVTALSSAASLPPKGIRRPLDEIVRDLTNDDRAVKGKALEYLAARLCRLLDLEFVAWRLRSNQTGGAEVDVILESARLVFSRWQIQCKNTSLVSLDDVAKEVGLAYHLKSAVVVVVGTGKVSRSARDYADSIMRATNLNVVILDGTDIRRISGEPTAIVSIFRREAQRAMEIKRLDI